MNDPQHPVPVHHFELRPRVTREEFDAAWTHLQEHLLNEMAAGEPEGRAVLDAIDTWLADTMGILALVEPPGRRAGISDVWDPLTASWRPTPSQASLMMRERLPCDLIVMSASGYQEMRNDVARLVEENAKLFLRQEASEAARAAEEAPKERAKREATLARLQAVLDKAPHSAATCPEDVYSDLLDAGHAAASAMRVPLWIAQRVERLQAWTRVAGFAAGNGAGEEDLAAVREELSMTSTEREELEDLRIRHGIAEAQTTDLCAQLDQIVALVHTPEPPVEGKDHSWKAPDTVELVREFVAQRRVLPADLVLRASMLAMALQQAGAEGAGPTTTADAAKLLFELVRVADQQPELVNDRFVDLSYMSDPDRTVLRFEGLPDIAVPDADVDTLVSEYMAKSPVRAARVMMQQATAKAPRLPYYLPASTRSEIHGAAGEGMVVITTNAAGEIAQVTCHDVGPEPEDEDEDGDHEKTLAARCKVTSDNLTTLLGSIGGETQVPEPLWSGVVTASILLDEVANVLRKCDRLYWIVDEYNDNEGETFGIAIPSSPEVDAALEKWCRSFAALTAAEDGRAPDEDPFEQRLGTGGSLTFRRHETSDDLQAIERVSDNSYSSRLRLLKPEGVEVLLKAISALPEGGSLSLYKGSLSTCFADESALVPEDVADLWKFCDEDMFGEGEGLGDHHHPDDMPAGCRGW